MDLPPGARLGPYEVINAIGAGGMGQVYRARDARLGRDVAIKLLASHLQEDEELRERFSREARAVAKLAHPHICALFDVGREGERDFLVMELLDGQTLASRLQDGPLRLDQALRFGAQIAAALAAAHASGIVHRDLKPANVMLTESGVKLLDFGLAKGFGPVRDPAVPFEPDPGLTRTGVVLGTVPYMAPEQIDESPLDQRSDIFALGAVVYEMAAGRPAFSAPNQAALVASVLTSRPPPIASIRPGTPASLDRLVRTCLEKDPAARWQSARDVELQLLAIAEEGDDVVPPTGARQSLHARVAWTIAALALLAAAGAYLRPGRGRGPAPPQIRFSIAPPGGGAFAYFFETNFLSVSPDGRQVAFVARDSVGPNRVWLRPLSATAARPLAGSENAQSVFWSPDARAVAFFTATRLVRLDLPDGAPVTLTALPSGSGRSGTWGKRGDILFAEPRSEAIYGVPSSGGTPAVVLARDTARGDAWVRWPLYLPDGEHFLYVTRPRTGPDQLMEASPDEPPLAITSVESLVQFAEPGLIVFVRDGTLLGQAFDWREGRVSGEPFAVADGIRYFLSTGAAAFASSPSGVLAFQDGRDVQRLAWIDRSGRELGTVGSLASYLTLAISPDGRRLLSDRENAETGTWDVWMTDLERDSESPVTSERRFTEAFGRWLPGTRSVVYSVAAGGAPNLVLKDLTTGSVTTLHPEGAFQQAQDVSPDGRTLLYARQSSTGTFDLWTLPLEGDGPPTAFVESPFEESQAEYSHDGRFVALISDETGRPELYVTPFPGPGEKVRVSSEGARRFRWVRNARELVYLTLDRRVVAVPVHTDAALRLGAPATLFTLDAAMEWSEFDVSPDGRRFLASIPVVVADERPITVISDWTQGRR